MRKKIWILNHYASNMLFDGGGRHYCFSKYLKREGYEPVVFCSNAIHNTNRERVFDNNNLWNEKVVEEIKVPFICVQTRTYVGNGKQRVLNMIDFYRNVKKVMKEYASIHGKPDIIYASSAHPLAVVAGIKLAKHFGVKCICEIRDFWPESIVSYGVAGAHNPGVIALRRIEKWIYKKSDAIVFTMENAYAYIIRQGWEKEISRSKVFYINNGVDLEQFEYNKEYFKIEDEDLDNPSIFKVVYTGSIRKVNNLGLLLDSSKLVKNKNVKFLVWGVGDELPFLKKRVEEENISNVVFKGYVNKKFIPYIVSSADVNFAHCWSPSVDEYGISFNKIFDYMAAGRPIFCDFSRKYNPAIMEECGVDVANTTPEAIASEIDYLAGLTEVEYKPYCDNAMKAAHKYDFEKLTGDLVAIIENV